MAQRWSQCLVNSQFREINTESTIWVASCCTTEQKSKASNAFANVIIVEFVKHIIGLFVLTGGKRQYVAPASPAWTAIPRKPSRLTFRTLWDLNQADEWSTLQVAVIGKRWSVAGQEHGFDDRQFSPFGKARLKQRSNLWLDFCTFQPVDGILLYTGKTMYVKRTRESLCDIIGWSISRQLILDSLKEADFTMIGLMFLYCWNTLERSVWWTKTPAPIGPRDPSIQLISRRADSESECFKTLRPPEWCDALIVTNRSKKTARPSNSRDFDWSSKWRSKMILSRVPSASRATLMTCLTFRWQQRHWSKLAEESISYDNDLYYIMPF